MKIKGFDENLCCRGFQFKIGREYKTEREGKPLRLCSDTVFHYCDSLQKVYNHYSVLREANRFCEIDVLGEEITDGEKCGSDHIKILREIKGEELDILKGKLNGNTGIFNSGNYNSGNYNSGNRNSGNRNSGSYNSGNCNSGNRNRGNYNSGSYNSGNRNRGNYNSGNRNSGSYNSGSCNSGNRNSGNYNSGSCNSGDYNITDHNAGCFCTENHKILFFDKESDMTYSDWVNSDAGMLLDRVDMRPNEWIPESSMTEEEKKKHRTYETAGGYLRVRDLKSCYAEWWEELSSEERQVIKDIPNFNAEKFKKITGIDVEEQGAS